MNYKLAKQLKDAGFPQEAKKFYFEKGQVSVDETEKEYHSDDKTKKVSVPTLEELIDACGEDFGRLDRVRVSDDEIQYIAFAKERGVVKCSECSRLRHGEDIVGNGDTPEEAVAKLWLKLNV